MYAKIRDLHLFFGLLGSAFLLIYALSAFMMGHSFLFKWAYPNKPKMSSFKLEAPPSDPKALVAALRAQDNLRGDLFEVKTTSTAVSFFVERPGSRFDVAYDVMSHTATVAARQGGFWYSIDRMHHTGGLIHDEDSLNAWGLLVAIMSVITWLIGLTGVYMWFKRQKERRVGGMIFVATFVFTGILLVLVRVM